jgi:hypothetical protein
MPLKRALARWRQHFDDELRLRKNHRTIDILYTLDSASLLVKLKPRIFQRLPPFE